MDLHRQADQRRRTKRAARLVYADGTFTVSPARHVGRRSARPVRVRNGEVAAQFGYGRFGAKVTMDAAALRQRGTVRSKRVRLSDIDGSGSTDILYIGKAGVDVYFNRSGNAWADGQRIAVFPDASSLSTVQAIDLLGNGTACLVWSSPLPSASPAPLRYVDLMGSRKPHLLIAMRNNLGAETRLSYAPSTRFYLEDEAAGRPWVTRLPFPVQVVERVEAMSDRSQPRGHATPITVIRQVERDSRLRMIEGWIYREHRAIRCFPKRSRSTRSGVLQPADHELNLVPTGVFEADAIRGNMARILGRAGCAGSTPRRSQDGRRYAARQRHRALWRMNGARPVGLKDSLRVGSSASMVRPSTPIPDRRNFASVGSSHSDPTSMRCS